jgi:uncharacterized protein
MITTTPFLAAAADAKLEDWGPLEEATGEPMHTSGTTWWSGDGAQETGVWECTWQIHETIRKIYVLF